MSDEGRKLMRYLLIVDLQKQFADNENGYSNYNRCLEYIKEHSSDYDGIVATYFRQNEKNPNYKLHLKWNGCRESSEKDLEFYDPDTWEGTIFAKNGYGDNSEEAYLTRSCFGINDQIDIIGCDADACVMAICFQLWDAGFTGIHILTDYIYTTADCCEYGIDKETWIQLMRRNFGDCVIIPKRRISYDALFLPSDNKKITYKGQEYDGSIALFFEYKFIGPNGKEWYIASDWSQPEHPYRFSIDRENGYSVSQKENYTGLPCFVFPSADACIWTDNSHPVNIPFVDGVKLLKENYDLYNNSNNRPAQSTCYSIRYLEDDV